MNLAIIEKMTGIGTMEQSTVVVDDVMSLDEARKYIEEIKEHLRGVRLLLLELERREGWKALGYNSMRACMVGEFGRSQSQLYRELKAGKIEEQISPRGEIGIIPEKHLRPIGKLPPEHWPSVWQEAVRTAPPKGVTLSHVENTVAKVKQQLRTLDPSLDLGDWVRIKKTRTRFDGCRGVVIHIDKENLTVKVDTEAQEEIKVHQKDVVKISPPNDELNQQVNPSFQVGDIVMINCPREAEVEPRSYNGYWGVVTNAQATLEVTVKGQPVQFLKSDVILVENPTARLNKVAEKVNILFTREDLDELDRHILEFYSRRVKFTLEQVERLDSIFCVN